MKHVPLIASLALACSSPALGVPGGEIDTLQSGRYACELPGDAAGLHRIRRPEHDFKVVSASSYVTDGKRGTYLLTGDVVVMTSGPFKGKRFIRKTDRFLRQTDRNGKEQSLRCVLATRNNM